MTRPSFNAARAIVVVLLGVMPWSACGGSEPGQGSVERGSSVVSGIRVERIAQRGAGATHLALWIDAGSRDADPPQVAALAAFSAAAHGGRDIETVVTPDGTVFSLVCAPGELDPCLSQLARVLSYRTLTSEDLNRDLRRLQLARRQREADDGSVAQRHALTALMGEGAESLFPLGIASDDRRCDQVEVIDFHRRHYGPARALLIAVGDVTREGLEGSVAAHFGSVLQATADRRAPQLGWSVPSTPSIAVGNSGYLAVALGAAADGDPAGSLARATANSLPPNLRERTDVHVFTLRGGGVVLLTLRAERAERADSFEDDVLVALAAMERMQAEGVPASTAPMGDDGPLALIERLGLAWTSAGNPRSPLQATGTAAGHGASRRRESAERAGQDHDPSLHGEPSPDGTSAEMLGDRSRGLALGIGLVVPGGRGDDITAEDPDAALVERTRRMVERAIATAREQADPATRGEVTANAASVVLDNGSRIDVRRQPERDRVALAIRFAASPDDRTGFRAAALAILSQPHLTGCAGYPAASLRENLRRIGARLSGQVDATRHGIRLEFPREALEPAIDIAMACALHPLLDEAAVENARLALLSPRSPGGQLRLAASLAVSDGRDDRVVRDLIAPLSDRRALREIRRSDLDLARGETRVGARVAVAVVGDVPVHDTLLRVARRLSGLSAGHASRTPHLLIDGPAMTAAGSGDTFPVGDGSSARAAVTTFEHDGATPSAVVAWASSARGSPAGARLLATAARQMADGRQIRVIWSDGDGGEWGAWAAVGLELSEAALDGLPNRVHAFLSSLTGERGAAALAAALRAERAAILATRMRTVDVADQIADQRLAGEVNLDDPLATARALLRNPPHYAIGRPTTTD